MNPDRTSLTPAFCTPTAFPLHHATSVFAQLAQLKHTITSYPDEEIENIYVEIDNIINSKAYYNIVVGDSNAKVGPGEIRETCTSSYGIGTRNRRGDRLVEFAEWHKFNIITQGVSLSLRRNPSLHACHNFLSLAM